MEKVMTTQTDVEIVIDEKISKKIEPPKKFHVIFLNDNKTPIDWVIEILIEIFRHNELTAQDLTLKIHNEGSAIVGTYHYEIAEQKLYETIKLSRDQGFPLMAKLEEE
jgi:ATP-dependent Clp protease adaptor protein ClpS